MGDFGGFHFYYEVEATMKGWEKGLIVVVLIAWLANVGAPYGIQSPLTYIRNQQGQPIIPPVTTVVTTGVGPAKGPFAIEFVLKSQDGALQTSDSVDLYHYDAAAARWVKDARYTSDGTTAKVTSGASYMEGQEVYVNVPGVADTQGEYWGKIRVKPWQGNPFTTCQIETIPQYGRPVETGSVTVGKTVTSASYMAIRLYGEDSTSISTTDSIALRTERSKASGLANMEGYFELEVNSATWQRFGGKMDVPKTDQGASARTLTSVFYVEVNSTSFTFDTSKTYAGSTVNWASATASAATSRRYCLEVPLVETRDTYPVKIQVYFYANFDGITSNSGLAISTAWTDLQNFEDTKNGVTFATSGANVGYSRSKSASFYVYIVA